MDLIGTLINRKYKITRKIGEGGMSTVWLAEDIADRKDVAIKILKEDTISTRVEDHIRFKTEAIHCSKLEISGIAKTYDVGVYNNLQYIVMEYIQGETLQSYIHKGYIFSTNEVLEIILCVSKILMKVHNANIIHRDIKPGNIILRKVKDNEYFQTTLIDFGLAQLRNFTVEKSVDLIGSIYYMPPEQSGFLNIRIDERSDLYSLGVVFYQLITGELPFSGNDINNVIYQHIAKLPKKIEQSRKGVSPTVEKIIGKLLEKEPDNRYQSAFGLVTDIEECMKGTLDFTIGRSDQVTKLDYRTNLIGRDEEFDALKLRFDEAVRKNGSMCLISGEGGKGKTRLLEELKRSKYDEDIIFMNGKCFSGESKIPYDPTKEILNDYVRYFKNQNENKRLFIKNKIVESIGNLGEVLLKFDPQMKIILGECPEIDVLEDDREIARFKNVISAFFRGLCESHKAIIIIMDDIQWIDEGSLTILDEISGSLAKRNMLVLGTYRNDEVFDGDKVDKFIKNLYKKNYRIFEFRLQSFDLAKTIQLISVLLHETEGNVTDIGEFILKKSMGNPYFSIEILKQLMKTNIIYKNGERWEFDEAKISKLDIPSSIVDIIVKRIEELSKDEIFVLSNAAILGKKLDMNFLFNLVDMEKSIIINIIDKAVNMQLVEFEHYNHTRINFFHDRVREAFLKYNSEKFCIDIHLKIANMLEKENKDDRYVFDLAHHYFNAQELEKSLKYLYTAGIKSKESYANHEAKDYFLQAIKILEDKGCRGTGEWTNITGKLSEIYILIGESKKAIELLKDVLLYKKDRMEKASIFRLISQAYFKSGDYVKCEEYTQKGMKLLGVFFPIKTLPVIAGIIREVIIYFGHMAIPKKHFLRERRTDFKYKLVIDFLRYTNWAYGLSDVRKFLRTTMQTLNIAGSKIGRSNEYALAITTYASMLMAVSLFEISKKHHYSSIKMCKKLNNMLGLAPGYLFLGHCYNWQGQYGIGLKCAKRCIEMYEQIGDLNELGMAINLEVQSNYYQGDYENTKLAIDRLHENSIKANDKYTIVISNIFYVQYYRETGEFEMAEKYGQKTIEYSYKISDWYNYCYVNLEVGMLYLEMNNSDQAIKHLEIAKKYYEKNNYLKQYTILVYIFLAEAYILKYEEDLSYHSTKENITKRKQLKNMCIKSIKSSKPWISHYGNALRVMAKYHILDGNLIKAEKYFLKSIEINKKINRKYEMAKAMYQYESILSLQNRTKESKIFLENAYNIFKSIGSKYYQNILQSKLGFEKGIISAQDRFSKDLRNNQRMSSIISVSQKISSILDLNILLTNVIQIIIEVSGAQNGYILLKNEKTGKMEVIIKKEVDDNPGIISESIINEVLEKGEAVFNTNAAADDKYSIDDSIFVKNVKSVLCLPIKYNNEITGICFLDNKLSRSVFTKDDIVVLNSILTQAAISIENAKLFKIAITDGLTGLITHKHFKYILEKEFNRCVRYKRNFSIIMFDVDHFKNVNDTFGHMAGDQVLMSLSALALETFRTSDVVARYGGEEFAIILTETDSEGVKIAAERFREKVSNMEEYYERQLIKVTISIGISFQSENIKEPKDILNYADRALYKSKASGRNRVTIYNGIEFSTVGESIITKND